jgi:hypothetical protein
MPDKIFTVIAKHGAVPVAIYLMFGLAACCWADGGASAMPLTNHVQPQADNRGEDASRMT